MKFSSTTRFQNLPEDREELVEEGRGGDESEQAKWQRKLRHGQEPCWRGYTFDDLPSFLDYGHIRKCQVLMKLVSPALF